MARISYPDETEVSAETRARLAEGSPLNLLKMMSYAESVYRGYEHMGRNILRHGLLPADLRELAILRVGHLTGSAYEKHQHVPIARKVGLDEAKIAASEFGADADIFSPREAALLRFIDDVHDHIKASAATFEEVSRHFTKGEIVELCLVTGYYRMTAGFLETFEIDIEEAQSLGTMTDW